MEELQVILILFQFLSNAIVVRKKDVVTIPVTGLEYAHVVIIFTVAQSYFGIYISKSRSLNYF